MTEDEIRSEAVKRAKQDALYEFGDQIDTSQKRSRLRMGDRMFLVEFLKQRFWGWVDYFKTPVSVKVDGKELERID